ncbi:Ribosomal protein L11 methyltransferase [Legionella massiliensis]|uniref:Ribosomal protein L11 methyltransferase n=1 Tax=Legionella massiliensis TaxID=1034943 RepID=A0A078KUM2_9GAMM|nr:50S ribosomal protein L11 methyltransferase [Legionella massiliensis]CDZ76741.1 Ribosomal protein L11 methyltransferase [Legionella massiliensis]CEE12479.1 Ribosomal protein L11 methyltransferase [Legionella massiliensis]
MWYQLQIEQCHRDKVELLSEALEETGALSITLTDKNDDPVLEPEPGTTPLWPDVIVNALYQEKDEAELAKTMLSAQFEHLSYAINEIADQDWERAWMDEFKPMRFGERLWICPSWIEPPEPEAVNLILDPGLAFGTGTHPTTSLCLRWLDQADLTNKSVVDYGCGSGILALAALKLGAASVHAVDIDEQALQATQNNALSNSVESKQLIIGFPEILKEPVDLLIANILLAPLLNLRSRFKELLKDRGMLVISGILAEQAAGLIEAYQEDFNHLETINHEGWSLLAFSRC